MLSGRGEQLVGWAAHLAGAAASELSISLMSQSTGWWKGLELAYPEEEEAEASHAACWVHVYAGVHGLTPATSHCGTTRSDGKHSCVRQSGWRVQWDIPCTCCWGGDHPSMPAGQCGQSVLALEHAGHRATASM